MEDYIFYMKDQQLHDTTINTNLRMVRAFLYWCMEKGYLEKYPIRLVRADDPIKEPYTTDELQKLLKEPDCKTCSFAEYRNWVIVNFLLGTGCRASTLLNLQIGDLDLSAGTVFFRHMKARNQQIVPFQGTGQDHGGVSGASYQRPYSSVVCLGVWQPDDFEFAWQCGVEL